VQYHELIESKAFAAGNRARFCPADGQARAAQIENGDLIADPVQLGDRPIRELAQEDVHSFTHSSTASHSSAFHPPKGFNLILPISGAILRKAKRSMNSYPQYRIPDFCCEFYRCFMPPYAKINDISSMAAKAGSQKVAYILDKIMRESKEIEIMSDSP